MSTFIRNPLSLGEWSQVREICCLTGNGGAPIETSRWKFFSEEWVGPYQRFYPNWTWVALEADPSKNLNIESRVEGYLTGCPNTYSSQFIKAFLMGPWLLFGILFGKFNSNADTRRWVRRFFGFQKGPESRFSIETRKSLQRLYPAHLHMNCRESARGKGVGSQLVEAYFSKLKSKGVPGIHLYCGEKPVQFYERNGFRVLEKIEFGAKKIPVYCMVASLK